MSSEPETTSTSSEPTTSTETTSTVTPTTTTPLPTTSVTSPLSSSVKSPDDNNGEFLFPIMAFVAGAVFLIIAIVIIAFVIKSKRRRRRNVRIYRERQERPATITFEAIDRDREENIQGQGGLNGVHNSIYNSDDILPITVFDGAPHRGHTPPRQPTATVQLPDIEENYEIPIKSRTREERDKDNHMQQPGASALETLHNKSLTQTTLQNEGSGSLAVESDTIGSLFCRKESPASASVYENTKFPNQRFLTAGDKQKQKSMPNLNDEMKGMLDKRPNIQKQTKSVSVSSNYETAFPMPFKKNKDVSKINESRNKDVNRKADLKGQADKCLNTDKDVSETSIDNVKQGMKPDIKVSNAKQEKQKPKVKPKPKARKLSEKPNEDENHDYENSLVKIKRNKFKDAKLLKTVPPPCNSTTYVNVPENVNESAASNKSEHTTSSDYVTAPDKKTIHPDTGIHRQSSEYVNVPEKLMEKTLSFKRESSDYEESENVLKLKKHAKDRSEIEKLRTKIEQAKDTNHVVSKNGGSKNKETKTSLLYERSKSNKFRQGSQKSTPKDKSKESMTKLDVPKPVYSNIAQRGRSNSENPERIDLNYENEDTFNELKSKVRKLKRGFSTPSLETGRQETKWRTELTNMQERAARVKDDELYLQMDADNNDDDLYLDMDSSNDGTYMKMNNLEEDNVYVPMEGRATYSTPVNRRAQRSNNDEDVGFARSYQTCPKPCSGVRSVAYANFSEQPTSYVNFFRSRSTDNIYSYAGIKPTIKY